ncbi:MAG: hypothetical protein ACMVY4_10690 [Minwuia sp.]|uniref:hypothetical protein n=1 Tax=Minwuia sp. TaxID=2493630 RepID=UPI003A8638B7
MTRSGSMLAVIALAAMAGGCAVTWPEHRGGGAAEISAMPHPVHLVTAADAGEQALQVQHARCLRRLEDAVQRDALRWAPAELVLAERLAIRAGREIAGGLDASAARNLIALRERIERIENAIARAAKPRDGVDL